MATFSVPTIFSAVDKITPTLDKVSSKIDSFQGKLNKTAQKSAIVGTALVGGLGYAVNEAIKFEDKLADVAKVMNLDVGSKALSKVGDEIKDMAVYLAQSPADVAELYGKIAQSGVAAENIGKVAKVAGEMGVAFDVAAGDAGESFVKLQNAMGSTFEETVKITDSINLIGNKTAAESKYLLEFMAAGGAGAARAMGMAGQHAAAVGSAFIGVGKSASEAGTIFERAMKGIMKDSNMRGIFEKNGKGIDGFIAVLEKGSKMKGAKQFEYFKKFGEYSTAISLLSENISELKGTLSLVENEQSYYNSSLLEFENRQKTTEAKIKRIKAQLVNLAISVGDVLLPALNALMDKVMPIVKKFTAWIKENDSLVERTAILAAGILGFSFALKVVRIALGIGRALMIAYTFAVAAYEAVALTAALGGYTLAGAIWAVAWPILLVVLAVVAIIAIFIYWDKICEWFGKQWEKFTNWIGEVWDSVVKWFEDFDFINFFKQIGNAVISFLLAPLRTVLSLVSKIPGKIGDLGKQALEMTHMIDFETTESQSSPAVESNKQLQETITTNNSSMSIDIKDKGGNIGNIQQFGSPVPVILNSTNWMQ